MSKYIRYILLFLCCNFLSFAQEEQANDDIILRKFQEDLRDKYTSEDFVYIEPEIKNNNNADLSWLEEMLEGFSEWLPVVIILLAVALIVRAIIKKEGTWFFGKSADKSIEKLELVDEEIIQNSNLEQLIANAINEKDYRLAIRYYYLNTLKKLSEKGIVKIDKDKTNSDYLVEIENQKVRKEFSYLSYVYDYVWYGEFYVDETSFSDLQLSFKNYNKTIS